MQSDSSVDARSLKEISTLITPHADPTSTNNTDANTRNVITVSRRASVVSYGSGTFYLNLILMMLINLISDAARGIVVPTQFIYVDYLGGGNGDNGLIFAIFVVGRFISSFVLGYVADRRPGREIFIFTSLIALLGHILYSIARLPSIEPHGLAVAYVGRFLSGFSTGCIACVRAIIVSISPPKLHTRYLSWSLAAQFIGYALAPGLCALFSLVSTKAGELVIDVLNLGSLVLGLLNLIVAIATFFFMPTIPPKKKKMGERRCSTGVVLYLFLFFIIRSVVAFIETVGGVEYSTMMNYSEATVQNALYIALYFVYLGLAGLLVYFCVEFVAKKVRLYYILIFSLLSIVAGCLMMAKYPGYHYSYLLFTFGAVCVWSIGGPAAQVVILAQYSELLGDGPKGAMLGWAATIGSVGSIITRVVSGYLELFGVYVACAFLSLIAVFMLAAFHSSPSELRRTRSKERERERERERLVK